MFNFDSMIMIKKEHEHEEYIYISLSDCLELNGNCICCVLEIMIISLLYICFNEQWQ
jgi:hypothetical protein